MPSRKRTHTTTSDNTPSLQNRKLSQTRRTIAAEAARIMATQGLTNFRLAKQKAAAQMGISSSMSLPSNVEVETALRAYQQFYGGQTHAEHIQDMRSAAVGVMRLLESFNPRLAGPVLEGTADQHAPVTVHLFSDPPDAVVMHMMEKRFNFKNEDRKIRWHDSGFRLVPVLSTEFQNHTLELVLFNTIDLRQAPPSPVDGRPQRRAPLSEVECLLAGVA